MSKNELQSILIDEYEYEEERVMGMSEIELFDTWLNYNGLIGWSGSILAVLRGCPDLLLEQLAISSEENEE